MLSQSSGFNETVWRQFHWTCKAWRLWKHETGSSLYLLILFDPIICIICFTKALFLHYSYWLYYCIIAFCFFFLCIYIYFKLKLINLHFLFLVFSGRELSIDTLYWSTFCILIFSGLSLMFLHVLLLSHHCVFSWWPKYIFEKSQRLKHEKDSLIELVMLTSNYSKLQ